jgi:small subunit ribosomal protein S16
MLVIRMQRTGRKGHAQFRVVVQDSRRTPTSGKVVALLGSYNPHTKTSQIDKAKAGFYLEHGAQPTDRVARLLKAEGVKLPKWVELSAKKAGEIRNPEKRRSTRPDEPEAPAEETPAEAEADAPAAEEIAAAPAEETADAPAEETEAPAEEPAAEETPAEEVAAEEAETPADPEEKA